MLSRGLAPKRHGPLRVRSLRKNEKRIPEKEKAFQKKKKRIPEKEKRKKNSRSIYPRWEMRGDYDQVAHPSIQRNARRRRSWVSLNRGDAFGWSGDVRCAPESDRIVSPP
jgi:23S rRNA A2030 N6-methylase RlmJ